MGITHILMDSLRASLTLSSKPVGFFNDQQLNSDAYIFSCWTMIWIWLTALRYWTNDHLHHWKFWHKRTIEVIMGILLGWYFRQSVLWLFYSPWITKQNKQTNRKSQTLLRGKTPLSLQPHEWLLLKCSDDGILYWKIFHQENVWFNPQ